MYLLDTHVLLWALADVARLTPPVRAVLDARLVKKPKRMFSPAFMDLPSLLNVLLSASL